MEVLQVTRYPLHGRVQVALPGHAVLSGHAVDISVSGICILLEDQIPLNVVYSIRFEMPIRGAIHVITAQAESIYGVFASGGGVRVGLTFRDNNPQRTELIKSLGGKKPMVDNPDKDQEHASGR